MAIKHLNKKARPENETGLGTNTSLNGGRFFNRNGQPNLEMRGLKFFQRLNVYHSLLSMPQWKFLAVVVGFFLLINLAFAGIYFLIGTEHLNGLLSRTRIEKIGEVFFFSAQTFTTVGYGRINPVGLAASLAASMEALTGLMSFAVVTGLFYGRFARPRAYIRFSEHLLFTPFKGEVALMFRMVPYTKNYLVNVEVKGSLALKVVEDGQVKTRFFNIPFEISKAITMTANWTLVHMINDESPLYGFTREDIKNASAEVLIFVQGFDESFSNNVVSRASYRFEEFIYGAKFLPMYHPNETNTGTVLHIDQLDNYEGAALPAEHSLMV